MGGDLTKVKTSGSEPVAASLSITEAVDETLGDAEPVGEDSAWIVELTGVSRCFDEATAVADLSFTVKRGRVLGLLGHNGSGKTTALRLISGVLTPTSGNVRVFGLDPTTQGPQVRRHTGALLSKPHVDRRLTGRENLRYTARLYGLDPDIAADRVDELAVSFHLDDRLNEPVERYSEGMRQRLALARVLLPNPSLLLLDEPTASLDPMAAHGVRQLVRDLAQSRTRTVVLATQDLIEATELCDHIGVLERGRLVAYGTPAELAGQVAARGLRLVISDVDHMRVCDLAAGLGYTLEPLETGRVCVHGVDYNDIPAFVRALAEAGVALYGVDVEQPTLTDLYLALHRRARASGSEPGGGDLTDQEPSGQESSDQDPADEG